MQDDTLAVVDIDGQRLPRVQEMVLLRHARDIRKYSVGCARHASRFSSSSHFGAIGGQQERPESFRSILWSRRQPCGGWRQTPRGDGRQAFGCQYDFHVVPHATVKRRQDEDWATYFERKRRAARFKATHQRMWSVTQNKRSLTFAGHIARMQPTRWASRVMRNGNITEWHIRLTSSATQAHWCPSMRMGEASGAGRLRETGRNVTTQ